MTLRIGQRVVCWTTKNLAAKFGDGEALPAEGALYTIRDVVEIAGIKGVRLVEIRNPVLEYRYGRYECTFHPSRFRPAVERKTDISIFLKMLTSSSNRAKERVS